MDLTDPVTFALDVTSLLQHEGVAHSLDGGRALARSLAPMPQTLGLRVLAPEGFILFKVLSTRDLDLEDAASIVRGLSVDLDHDLIQSEIDGLARAVAKHPIRERWDRVQRLTAP